MLVLHPKYLSADGAAAPGLDMPHLDGLAGFTHGNGLALLLNYDADGRLTGMNTADGLTEVQDLSLAYDAAADITAITDNLDPTRSQTFDYDDVGRLTWASGAYGEIDYTYDLVGNRTHRTIDDGTITDEVYAYGAGSHRLESVTVGSSARDVAYTAAGSTASDTRAGTPLVFDYNFAGRLETVTATSGTLASRVYRYDALQHRVREIKEDRVGGGIQASAVSYVYDLDGHLIAEAATLGSAPSVRREYIWLGDTPVGVVDHTMSGDPLLAIHTDHLGRPQKLTDASQAVVWDGQFDPFGEEHAVVGTTDLPLRFPGQEWDAATGLSQNWNRDYDPSLGRYIESDPIGLIGGMNTYGYAGNYPLSAIDPSGNLSIFGWNPRSHIPYPYWGEFGRGIGDFLRYYQMMRRANTIGADKFFHCMANCRAASRGTGGVDASVFVSEWREIMDEHLKGDSADACNADRRANDQGRAGPMLGCARACRSYRPSKLPWEFVR